MALPRQALMALYEPGRISAWRRAYGCMPELIGRVRYSVEQTMTGPTIILRGPFWMGPVPADDADLWPGTQMIDLTERIWFERWFAEQMRCVRLEQIESDMDAPASTWVAPRIVRFN